MKEEKLKQLRKVFKSIIENWLSGKTTTIFEDLNELINSLLIEVKIRINNK